LEREEMEVERRVTGFDATFEHIGYAADGNHQPNL
jgi:hypothetical protein